MSNQVIDQGKVSHLVTQIEEFSHEAFVPPVLQQKIQDLVDYLNQIQGQEAFDIAEFLQWWDQESISGKLSDVLATKQNGDLLPAQIKLEQVITEIDNYF